jgi:hypothetical protein
MIHFTPEEWADFARQRVSRECEAFMQDHLEAGCDVCVHTLQLWLGVLEVASTLNIHNPPESGVRFAKALYRVVSPQASRDLRVEVARLVFPTFHDMIAQGVRAADFYKRHFLFQRGELLLDVQIELRPETGMVSMAGQLLDPLQPSSRFGERQVSLVCESAELARAVTNQFGEFHLEFKPAEDVMLVINLESESLLVTPLPPFVLSTTPPGSGLELATENDDARNF